MIRSRQSLDIFVFYDGFIVFLDRFSYDWYFFEDCVISTFQNLRENSKFDADDVRTENNQGAFGHNSPVKMYDLVHIRIGTGLFWGLFS